MVYSACNAKKTVCQRPTTTQGTVIDALLDSAAAAAVSVCCNHSKWCKVNGTTLTDRLDDLAKHLPRLENVRQHMCCYHWWAP